HHSMEMWEPRLATSLKEARARTNLVHIIRLLFTIGAMLSAGVLIGYLINHAINGSTVVDKPGVVAATVVAPRFAGRDANDKPYVLTADTARRRRENVAIIDLKNPRLEDATSGAVQARDGVWNEETKVLDLVGDVVMTDAAGYTFTADRTRMFVEENRVEGQTPLHGVGPVGEARADSYEVLDDGDHIVLKGNVWTKFTRKRNRDGTLMTPREPATAQGDDGR
ncbi:MAG TPA: LPS export ABC transporter periplasmic protein LptC, partial [Hyphomonadaceae bacterium]|nr:LPS export ABC transporter periplasmic protein LptC [Hyphomonadaceae bacterium]